MASRDNGPSTADTTAHIRDLYRRIYEIVRAIPPGRVATYGQLAELAGIPGGARVVGAAMRTSVPELGLPWQRVVGKRARGTAQVSIHDPVGAAMQRAILEQEGVEITATGGISLAAYGWMPGDAGQGSVHASRPRRGRAAAQPGAAPTPSGTASRKNDTPGSRRRVGSRKAGRA